MKTVFAKIKFRGVERDVSLRPSAVGEDVVHVCVERSAITHFFFLKFTKALKPRKYTALDELTNLGYSFPIEKFMEDDRVFFSECIKAFVAGQSAPEVSREE